VSNGSSRSATVYLFRSDSGATLLTLPGLQPHAVREVAVRLASKVSYSWACDLRGYPDHVSESATVPKAGSSGAQVVPVYVETLLPALDAYRRYAGRMLAALGPDLTALEQAARSGRSAKARDSWLAAHLTWLRIGQDDGAYGAFGELGQQIDGTAAGLVSGARSRAFTGFHRIEDDLWRRRNLAAAAADTARLQRLVARLVQRRLSSELPATKAAMISFTIRCHEVLEDALRDSLSGEDDYGSHTDLQSLGADLSVTRELLKLLAPDLDPRAPALVATAQAQLRAISEAIRAARRVSSSPTLRALPNRQRQRLDQAVGAALETLSRVPDLLGIGGGS
jgi:iron uptake system EfeUOB component EfeO/EfeM